MIRRKLPSANALFAFEAAYRAMNFSRAARELNITQPAVSRAIAGLEDQLDRPLFVRHGPRLELTESGRILGRATAKSFQAIDAALDQIAALDDDRESITLSISTAMAAHWMIPRIDAFHQAFPTVNLNFHLHGGEPTGPVAPHDLGVRLGGATEEGQHSWAFAPEMVFAVGSPGYLANNGGLDEPSPGAAHTVVMLSNPRVTWREFLAHVGLPDDRPHQEIIVPDYSVVLHAALSGKGLVLAFVSSASRLIGEGSLVPATSRIMTTGRTYYIVAASEATVRPIVLQVRDWMTQEMADDLRRLNGQR